LALAREGADVAINYLTNEDMARQVARQVEAEGGNSLVLQADIANSREVDAMFASIEEEWGGLDVLVNNAGGRYDGTLLEVDEATWLEAFRVHVAGVAQCCRLALPAMIEKRQGVIINIGSVAGLRGVPGIIAYATVKAAVMHLTRCLAREVGQHNVRVNCVGPGIIDTDFHATTPAQAIRHATDNRIVLHRLGQAEEVAQAVVFLVKNEYITGETLMIDGGLTMRIA
ncbi:MAG TPA: SDR family oxidoreductase, partial [Candidatus Latescibacteria bacterium]|nr:SDR family oxidoreductase [Candidatus Latescibacterota bacterium]